MSVVTRRASGVSGWLAAAVVVVVHAGLAVLAVRELAVLGWLIRTWFELAAVSVVLGTAAAGVSGAAVVLARAIRGSRVLRDLAGAARVPCPAAVGAAAAGLGLAADIDVVRATEPFAVTYRLIRPRILVSSALAETLGAEGIAAVLAHERHHVRHRDPLRLLAVRVAAAYGCWLPAAAWLAGRLALRLELAADRAAVGCASRGDLASALLKLASVPPCPALAAARPARDDHGSLDARVAQLEGSRPRRPRPAPGRLLASGGTLTLVALACLCCAALSQALPGGLL